MRHPKFYQRDNAMTLVEILLVMVIIGLIAAMVLPSIAGRGEEARLATARTDIEANLATALDLYELDNGRYPTTEQGLRALLQSPTAAPEPAQWKGPYLKRKRLPMDPWGNAYVYVAPGRHNLNEYDLVSYGPDGIESEDDIVNWSEDDVEQL